MPCAGRDFPYLFLPRQPAFSRACFSGADFLPLPYDDRTLRLQRRGVRGCPPCGCHARGIVCLPLRGRHDPFGCRHPYGAPYRRVAAQRDGASPRRGFPLFRYRIPPNARRGALRPRMWRRRRGLRRAHPRRAGRRAAYGCPGRRGGADADHLPPGVRHGVRPGGGARSGGGCRMPPDPDLGGPQYGRRRHRHAAGVGGAGRRAHRTDGRQRRQPLECAAAGGTGVDAVHFSARSVRPGGMVFRNPHVSMGDCGDVSEYDLLCADERLIRQILTLLEP